MASEYFPGIVFLGKYIIVCIILETSNSVLSSITFNDKYPYNIQKLWNKHFIIAAAVSSSICVFAILKIHILLFVNILIGNKMQRKYNVCDLLHWLWNIWLVLSIVLVH